MIRAVVVDDSPLGRQRLLQLSSGIPDLRIVDECETGSEALEAIGLLAPDVVFLDVELPDGRGFDLLDGLAPDVAPAVVFVTGHERYAVDAFRVNAVDFLLKPLKSAEFQRAVDRVRRLPRRGAVPGDEPAVSPGADAARPQRRITVREGDRLFFMEPRDILWLVADRNHVRIGTMEGVSRLRGPLQDVERRLDPARFLRIRRGTVVNLDRVREVRRGSNSKYTVVTEDGETHAVSRSFRPALLDHL